ncbi:hypothetical protein EST38_g6988 [Candolleomyces aberdarensis]|uniref:Uncharacterized protein n=1 Tax=Candolleomyces aberdarensis TaxID=2316362 RepID=A0A4Q2DID9_9AGAR|nr:hypothetical protein EST38_g6988 [Candolleomyces aberdarensis]
MPPQSSTQQPSNLAAAELDEVQRQMDVIFEAVGSSDLAVTREALKKSHILIADLLRKLKATTAELASAETQLVNFAAEKRNKRRGKGPKIAGDPLTLSPLEKQAQLVLDVTRVFGKLYTLFFNPYLSDDLFGVSADSVGWSRNDVSVRYDQAFPDNQRIGRSLDLLFCLPIEARKMAQDKYKPFVKQMLKIAESERTQMAHRAREAALDIYEPIRNVIDQGFADLKSQGVRLTFKRPGQKSSETEITSFAMDLFLPDCNLCRKAIPGLGALIGIVEYAPGKFSSTPLCPLLYKSHCVVAGEEFLSPVLFRLARAVLYGPRSAMKTEGLVFNAKNPLADLTTKVTPGLIAGFAIVARVVLSPDPSFSKDGKGSSTGVNYAGDMELYTQFLMSIWNEAGGRKVIKTWTENLFPTATATTSTTSTEQSGSSADQPHPPLPSETIASLIARNRLANQVQPEAELEEDGFYQLPTTEDPDASFYAMRDQEFNYREEEEDDEDEGSSEDEDAIQMVFDEENGLIVEETTRPLIVEDDSPQIQAHLTRDHTLEGQASPRLTASPSLPTVAPQTRQAPPPLPPRSTRPPEPSPAPALTVNTQSLTSAAPPSLLSSSATQDNAAVPGKRPRPRPRPRPLVHQHTPAISTPPSILSSVGNPDGDSPNPVTGIAAAVQSLTITANVQNVDSLPIQEPNDNQTTSKRRTTRSTAAASVIAAPSASNPANPTQLSVIAELDNESLAGSEEPEESESRSKGKAKGTVAGAGKSGKRKARKT